MFVFVWSFVITIIDATMTNPSLQLSSLQEKYLHDELDTFSIHSSQHENLTEGGVETDGILPDSSPLSLLLSVQPELHRPLPLHVRSLRGAAGAGLEISEGHHQYHHLPPPSIYTSHGCLLIPVFFAAWWYYTKNMCRRMRGLLRHNPEPEDSSSERFHEKFGRARFGDAYTKWYVAVTSYSQLYWVFLSCAFSFVVCLFLFLFLTNRCSLLSNPSDYYIKSNQIGRME
jgi:hypothetical protein